MPTIYIAHGFGSSDEVAKIQSPNLAKALTAKGFNVEYIRAPHQLTIDDFRDEDPYRLDHDITKYKLYTWWNFTDTVNDLTEAKSYIKSLTSDDVVGIIGLSQGGSLAGLISANYEKWLPSLKFGIAFGGFYYPSSVVEPKLWEYNGKIDIPFLTVVGEKDTVITPEQSITFAQNQVNDGKSEVLRHDGGHSFAESDQDVEKVIQWITNVLN